MNVTSTNSAVSDPDVHIRFLKTLWLELPPDHLTLNGVFIEAKPSLELVIVWHCCGLQENMESEQYTCFLFWDCVASCV